MCPELVEDEVLFNLIPEFGPLLPLLGEYVASNHRVFRIRLKLREEAEYYSVGRKGDVRRERVRKWGRRKRREGEGEEGRGRRGGTHI